MLEDGWRDQETGAAGGAAGCSSRRRGGWREQATDATWQRGLLRLLVLLSPPLPTVRYGGQPPPHFTAFALLAPESAFPSFKIMYSALFVFLFSRLSVLLPPALRLLRLRFASLAAAEEREDAHQDLLKPQQLQAEVDREEDQAHDQAPRHIGTRRGCTRPLYSGVSEN